MTLKLEFVKRDIAGETFLVPIGDAAKQYSGLFALSEVGSFIWDKILEGKEEEDILKAILEEYQVTRVEAQADMKEFLDKLREMKIL